MMKVRIIFLICLYAYNSFSLSAQTLESAYTLPLSEIIEKIESRFGIKVKYDKKLIEGKTLAFAEWRILPWSAEESLKAVLAPFDYVSWKESETTFNIRSFEYHRSPESSGEQFLEYLKTQYTDKEMWERRKVQIKKCLPEALRLSPLPEKPDSKVILTPVRKYTGYTIENFAIETLPGIYVCGSIYRPVDKQKKHPLILNPNGHFEKGRYREDHQKRCAMLARMGAIAVSWDLFAWGESLLQFTSNEHTISVAQSIQMLNSIRILDYMLTMKDVDDTRVGITGGSGGGSMTMMMSAIDSRITLIIPVVMVSSHFAGGCPCETGMPTHLCGNRTNNAEITAMFAPRPQLIISDGKDWTSTVPDLEFPFIKHIYGFYDSQNMVENVHFPDEGHDYGFSKRQPMYAFVAKHFNLDITRITDKSGIIDESKVTIEKEEQLFVFGKNGEKLPPNAIKGRDSLIKLLYDVNIYP